MSEETAALRCVCGEFSSAVHEPSEKDQEQLRLLLREYGKPTLLAAIRDAKGKGRSVNYLRTILENWKRTGTPRAWGKAYIGTQLRPGRI